MFQIHRPQLRRCTEQRRTKDDTEVANGHVIDFLHAADSVSKRSWKVSRWLDKQGIIYVLVKMTHKMFESCIVCIR